jgi:hypothetical protein
MEEYEIVGAMFHGFDYSSALGGSLAQLLALARPAMEHILSLPSAEGEDEPRKRYLQHTTALSRAFALAVPLPAAIAFWEKLLNRGKDHATGGDGQQLLQVSPVVGLYGLLSQQLLTSAESAEQLVVEVIAVGQHDDGWIPHRQVLNQLPRIESHREALA